MLFFRYLNEIEASVRLRRKILGAFGEQQSSSPHVFGIVGGSAVRERNLIAWLTDEDASLEISNVGWVWDATS